MTRRIVVAAFALLISGKIDIFAQNEHVDLALPTANDALFREGGGPDFYQYIERDYQGEKSTPWEGGRYGFVRDPKGSGDGVVYTRFHEGIDIKPLERDVNGDPLDEIHAIADGKVVHANSVASYSNYGRYVVIEHRFDGCNYYSLYGHLSTIGVKVGQRVSKGEKIAVMGYTGVGINRERAHVHLELNLLLSHKFESWHDAVHPHDPNHNGIYNGINLTGLDIARLYLALRKNPGLTIPEFMRDEETFYKVALPRSGHFELARSYPWMIARTPDARTKSWEVSFARSGLPLQIDASTRQVRGPELTWVKKTSVNAADLTINRVTGRGGRGQLTSSGATYAGLLIWPD
jgi:murein DD-endopeptidase MepM/ murein hydrolase activator NlpD